MNDILLSLIVAVVIAAAGLVILGINPWNVAMGIARRKSSPPLGRAVRTAQGKIKPSFLTRQFQETKVILKDTYREGDYERCKKQAGRFAIIGAIIGVVFLNPFLSAVLALTGMFIPLFAVRLTAISIRKELAEESYTTMSVITTNYQLSYDLICAVKANVKDMHEPMKGLWEAFLRDYENFDPNISNGVRQIRSKINDPVWHEWCDNLLLCLANPSRHYLLTSTVRKAVQKSRVQSILDAKLDNPMVQAIGVILIAIASIPICGFFYSEWGNDLLYTWGGKLSIAVIAATCLFLVYKAVHASRPINLLEEVDKGV